MPNFAEQFRKESGSDESKALPTPTMESTGSRGAREARTAVKGAQGAKRLAEAPARAVRDAQARQAAATAAVAGELDAGDTNFAARFRAQNADNEPARPPALTLGAARLPETGMTRIPGTGVEIPEEAATVARVGLQAAGEAAANTALGPVARGGRLARTLLEAGATGLGAAGGAVAGEALLPRGVDPLTAGAEVGTAAAVSDAVFSGVGGLILSRLTAAPNLEPEAAAARQQLQRSGTDTTAGRVSRSPVVDMLETISEFSMFGRTRVRDQLERAEVVAQEDLDQVVANALRGADREQVQVALRDTLEEGVSLFNQTGAELYRALDTRAQGSFVDLNAILDWRMRQTPRGEANPGAIGGVLNVIDGQLERIYGVPAAQVHEMHRQGRRLPLATFSSAQGLRSQLIALERVPQFIAEGGKGITKAAVRIADDEIEAAGTRLGLTNQDAYQAFRAANDFWSTGREVMRDQMVESILRASPDHVIDMVLQRNSPVKLRQLRQIAFGGLGEDASVNTAQQIVAANRRILANPRTTPEGRRIAQARVNQAQDAVQVWEGLQGAFLFKQLEGKDASSGMSGQVDFGPTQRRGAAIRRAVSSYGEDTLRELFPSGMHRRNFEQALRTLEIVQAPAGRNVPGRIAIQLQTPAAAMAVAGAILTFSYTTDTPTAAAILLTPALAGRLMVNARFQDWLMRAANPRNSVSTAARAWAQVATLAAAEGARVTTPDGRLINGDIGEQLGAGLAKEGLRSLGPVGQGR